MKFALIEREAVHQIFETAPVLAPGLEILIVSDDVQLGYVRTSGGDLVPPPEPAMNDFPVSEDAIMRLARTERVVLYFFEQDEPVPTDWKAYRAALRLIRDTNELPDGEWPIEPALPAGL